MSEGDLRKDGDAQAIKRLMEIAPSRVRHRKGLPVRGQDTKATPVPAKGPEGASGRVKKAQ